jgi:hypothetical protein
MSSWDWISEQPELISLLKQLKLNYAAYGNGKSLDEMAEEKSIPSSLQKVLIRLQEVTKSLSFEKRLELKDMCDLLTSPLSVLKEVATKYPSQPSYYSLRLELDRLLDNTASRSQPSKILINQRLQKKKSYTCPGCVDIPTHLEGWRSKRSFCEKSRQAMVEFFRKHGVINFYDQLRLLQPETNWWFLMLCFFFILFF